MICQILIWLPNPEIIAIRPERGRVDESSNLVETKFTKSKTNRRTENVGLAVLLRDARFQVVSTTLKRDIASRLGIYEAFGTAAFDAVMTDTPAEPLDGFNLDRHMDSVHLIEMKTTRRPIVDAGLGGFFFGATEREYGLARRLGDRYLFAFVVLSTANKYGAEFFVLLTLDEVEERTRVKRTQFQVNLNRVHLGGDSRFGSGPGSTTTAKAAETTAPYD
jgi:hypothetical protein